MPAGLAWGRGICSAVIGGVAGGRGFVLWGGTTLKTGREGWRAADLLVVGFPITGRRPLTSTNQEGLTVKTAHAATTQMLAATMNPRRIFFPPRGGADGGPDARVTGEGATGREATFGFGVATGEDPDLGVTGRGASLVFAGL
jgi:hypothetical protein